MNEKMDRLTAMLAYGREHHDLTQYEKLIADIILEMIREKTLLDKLVIEGLTGETYGREEEDEH